MEILPLVTDLLARPNVDESDRGSLIEQLARLGELASERGWAERWCGSRHAPWYLGYHRVGVHQLRHVDRNCVIVILGWWSATVPGSDIQELLALDESGGLIDIVCCTVNSRLTRMGYNRHFTEVLAEPGPDGAVLVVRLEGSAIAGNYSHGIRRGSGEWEWFNWSGAVPETEWATRGLCRVGFVDGQMQVLFPTSNLATVRRA